jgi:2-oxoisovalerate dehydrogenase E2 component (dihydrolipoyl transacylase)
MSTFKLPDLGEGLAEAEIREWHVKPGDCVLVDQPMVSVETAKAVVEVPVPFSGTVTALHAAVGDVVATGARLIDLDSSTVIASGPIAGIDLPSTDAGRAAIAGIDPPSTVAGTRSFPGVDIDSGTVVGTMPTTSEEEFVESVTLGRARAHADSRARAVPVARALAKRLGLELGGIAGSGPGGVVTLDDVILHGNIHGAPAAGWNAAGWNAAASNAAGSRVGGSNGSGSNNAAASGSSVAAAGIVAPAGSTVEPLRGARRAMAHSMSMSRDQVSGSTVCDDADIHFWTQRGDYMLRLIRAMIGACVAEPALNAWYDSANNSRVLLKQVDLAIAVDTPGGLIVPVLRNIQSKTPDELRAAIIAQKDAAHRRSTTPEDLRDFTLMLSNFGTLAGRYGIPLVVPPAVAILGAGKVSQDAVVVADRVVAHRRMPLSLSFDHRCITGGEACRFLAAVIADLEKPD